MTTRRRLTEILRWLHETDPLSAPGVEERARLLLLDTLGCFIAAQSKPEPAALARCLAEREPGSVTLPGLPQAASVSGATFLLALGACWDEACEGLARAHGRPGLHAIPPALAVVLGRDGTLGEALRAIVTGYEVGGRMGEALRIKGGMHVDGAWGALGAAAAAARAEGGDVTACRTAVETVACQIPFSLYAPVSAGATARNTYCGHGAQLGLMAARSALAGIDSPADAIDDYFRIALDGESNTADLANPGTYYLLEGYLKPFAAVRHVHYGAQGAIDWRRQNGAETTEIRTLTLRVYAEAITYCGNRDPQSAIQAQFSLSYGLARALVAGDLAPDAYAPEALADIETRRLERLLVIQTDDALTAAGRRGATLVVEIADGSDEITVDQVIGDPACPLDAEATRAKFLRYATPIIGEDAEEFAAALIDGPLEAPIGEVLKG